MVNKKYVDSKIFTLDVTKGPDMNGSKDINVADPTSATDGGNERYVDTKTSNYLISRILLTLNSRIFGIFKSRVLRTFNGRILRTFDGRI